MRKKKSNQEKGSGTRVQSVVFQTVTLEAVAAASLAASGEKRSARTSARVVSVCSRTASATRHNWTLHWWILFQQKTNKQTNKKTNHPRAQRFIPRYEPRTISRSHRGIFFLKSSCNAIGGGRDGKWRTKTKVGSRLPKCRFRRQGDVDTNRNLGFYLNRRVPVKPSKKNSRTP